MSNINLQALKIFGHENFSKVLNAGVELSSDMLNFATELRNQGVAIDEAVIMLQQLFPKQQSAVVPGNVYYIHQPTVVVYGNVDGAIHNGTNNGSSSGKRASSSPLSSRKKKKNPNGDWVFEGDKVFLNSEWHKAVADCEIPPVEGATIIQTNNNGTKKKVGYYSSTPLSLNGFQQFHNRVSSPTLKYGKGPEGYYYIKNSVLSGLKFLESSEEVEVEETETTETNTSTEIDVEVKLDDVNLDF